MRMKLFDRRTAQRVRPDRRELHFLWQHRRRLYKFMPMFLLHVAFRTGCGYWASDRLLNVCG